MIDEFYQVKREYAIISSDVRYGLNSAVNKACVVAFFYYEDKIDEYIDYLKKIPEEIFLYIVSSKEDVLLKLREKNIRSASIEYRLKDNRGRDVSAIFVACRDLFSKYKYLCFVHDKKEKIESVKEDIRQWEKGIWNNLLLNDIYIRNVIAYLDSNSDVGLLVPPYIMSWNSTPSPRMHWLNNNKENTEKLAYRILNKKILIDNTLPSVAIGTCFWCKCDALSSICDCLSDYTDFPEEPLENDGTISHAVERVLPYVAIGMGYMTKQVMASAYASERMKKYEELIFEYADLAEAGLGISSTNMLQKLNSNKRLSDFCKNNNEIYLYGAGRVGNDAFKYLTRVLGISIAGYIDERKHDEIVNGVRVFLLSEVSNDSGIVISVGVALFDEVFLHLKEKGYDNTIWFLD